MHWNFQRVKSMDELVGKKVELRSRIPRKGWKEWACPQHRGSLRRFRFYFPSVLKAGWQIQSCLSSPLFQIGHSRNPRHSAGAHCVFIWLTRLRHILFKCVTLLNHSIWHKTKLLILQQTMASYDTILSFFFYVILMEHTTNFLPLTKQQHNVVGWHALPLTALVWIKPGQRSPLR